MPCLRAYFILALATRISAAAPTWGIQPPSPSPPPPSQTDIINYSLSFENMENAFYRDSMQSFSLPDFINAGYDMKLYNEFREIAIDKELNVKYWRDAVASLGGIPVDESQYNFTLTNVHDFISTSHVLEGVTQQVYLILIGAITDAHHVTYAENCLRVDSRRLARIRAFVRDKAMQLHQELYRHHHHHQLNQQPSPVGGNATTFESSSVIRINGTPQTIEDLLAAAAPCVAAATAGTVVAVSDGEREVAAGGESNPLSRFRNILVTDDYRVFYQNVITIKAGYGSGGVGSA